MLWDGTPDTPEDEGEEEGWAEDQGDVPFLPDGLHDEAQPWRGVEHPANWPEQDAGPEYWAWKEAQAREDTDDEDSA